MVRSTRVWARRARFILVSLITTRREEGVFDYRWVLSREVWLDGYRSGHVMVRAAIMLRGARKLKVRAPLLSARDAAVFLMW